MGLPRYRRPPQALASGEVLRDATEHALVVTLLDVLAFVADVFAFAEGELDLEEVLIVEVKGEGHEGRASVVELGVEFAYL